jgi:hypothetical protein
MDLVVLFGYYSDDYESYVETLATISGNSHDDNPQWIKDEQARIALDQEYKAMKVVRLRLTDKVTHQIEAALGMHDVEVTASLVEIEGV